MSYCRLMIMIILCSLLLSGCFTQDSPTPIGEEGETIHLLGVVGVHETVVDLIEKELAESHIKLEKSFYYWDTYLAKARLAIMNDTREYDIILGPCSQLSSFINNNKVIALEDVAERATLKKQDLYPSVRRNVVFNGKFYCLPYLADSMIFIYRKDLFQKAELIPPRTITDMYLMGKKLTSGNNYGLAFPAGPGEAATQAWSYFLWSYGGEYFDKDWHPSINSNQALNATYIYNQILQECAPPAVATWQTEEAINFFLSGHLASMILWSGASNILNDKNRSKVAGKIGYTQLPVGVSGQAVPSMEVWGVIIPRTSQHIISAKKFCELLISRSTLENLAQNGIVPTPVPAINMHFASEFPGSSFNVATKSLVISRERPNIPEAIQFIPVISSALNNILVGTNLKETLDNANQQIEGIMQLNGHYK